MKLWRKFLTVPISNVVTQIEAIQMWEVRWYSRHDDMDWTGHPEMEAFPTREAAEHFRDALVNAFALVRHYGAHRVKLSRSALDSDSVIKKVA